LIFLYFPARRVKIISFTFFKEDGMVGKICGTVILGLFLGYGTICAQINANGVLNANSNLNVNGAFTANGYSNFYHQLYIRANDNDYYGLLVTANYCGAHFSGYDYGIEGYSHGSDGIGIGLTEFYGGYFYCNRGCDSAECVGVLGIGIGGGTGTGYGIGVEAFATGSNSAALYAHGGDVAAGYFQGNLLYTGSASHVSDQKFKTNISTIQNDSMLKKVMQLQPKTYFFDTLDYKEMNFSKKRQIGLVAQDVETVFPDLVTEVKTLKPTESNDSLFINKNGKMVLNTAKKATIQHDSLETFKALDYTALQEQQKEIEALKNGR
jgi:hypothetical protein